MSGVKTSEAQYALCIMIVATLWAGASFLEHSYFDWMFEHTPTSGLLLSAGARLFLLLAFRWRGAFAVSALMVAYKFHDGPQVDGASQVLMMGVLWGVIPFLSMELTSKLWRIDSKLAQLKQKHLFLYAWIDSLAVFGLTLFQLSVFVDGVSPTALWITGAIAATSNFLGIVLLMSITFFAIKFFIRKT